MFLLPAVCETTKRKNRGKTQPPVFMPMVEIAPPVKPHHAALAYVKDPVAYARTLELYSARIAAAPQARQTPFVTYHGQDTAITQWQAASARAALNSTHRNVHVLPPLNEPLALQQQRRESCSLRKGNVYHK